jgi:hypothetical protein
VPNASTLPYKHICSKWKLGDIYWLPSNGLYFCNLFKSVTTCYLDIHINTTIEIDDSTLCVAHVKGPWLLLLMWNVFLTKYSNERLSKIELPSDLKINGVFPLNPIREFFGYNENFKFQEVVGDFLMLKHFEIYFFEFFWILDFSFIYKFIYFISL